jgi:hypothetical protein
MLCQSAGQRMASYNKLWDFLPASRQQKTALELGKRGLDSWWRRGESNPVR